VFALIITILSIALVALLAITTGSYMGDIMGSAGPKQSASLIVGQATQVAGAARVYAATRNTPNFTVQDLVTENLLKSVPTPPFSDGAAYTITAEGQARLSVTNEKVCAEIQRKLTGNVTIPVVKPAQGCYNSDGAYVFILNG
jgi:hypothetical protein